MADPFFRRFFYTDRPWKLIDPKKKVKLKEEKRRSCVSA